MAGSLLIVDDEKEICEMLSRNFRMLGYSVKTASNGIEALDLLAKAPVDVVISDIMMPKMNGMEVLRRVKETHPEIKVIMVTGMAQEETQEQAMSLGAFHYLPKPFDPDLFSQLVQRALTSTN